MSTPEAQLRDFISAYTPEVAQTTRKALAKMKKLIPGAAILVYDNYNALAIGFSPTGRSSDAIVSLAVFPRWVSLFFMRGASFPDPDRILQGSGKLARHIVLDDAKALDDPKIQTMIAHALSTAPTPIDAKRKGELIIKSISPTQRPRRP